MAKFTAAEIDTRLGLLDGWVLATNEIVRTFEFKDFVLAMAFVNRVAAAAEGAGHHPDIDIRYNKVRLALTSHDAGGLTVRDFELAAMVSDPAFMQG